MTNNISALDNSGLFEVFASNSSGVNLEDEYCDKILQKIGRCIANKDDLTEELFPRTYDLLVCLPLYHYFVNRNMCNGHKYYLWRDYKKIFGDLDYASCSYNNDWQHNDCSAHFIASGDNRSVKLTIQLKYQLTMKVFFAFDELVNHQIIKNFDAKVVHDKNYSPKAFSVDIECV